MGRICKKRRKFLKITKELKLLERVVVGFAYVQCTKNTYKIAFGYLALFLVADILLVGKIKSF